MATKRRASFGNITKLPSGRWRARYTSPGTTQFVNAPSTFDTKLDAETWLSTVRSDLVRGAWLPRDSGITFGDYSATWLDHRTLKPRTRSHYRSLLDAHLLPTFRTVPVRKISPALVREWHARTALSTPTLR